MTAAHRTHARKAYEDDLMDNELRRLTMEEHWEAGYDDVRKTFASRHGYTSDPWTMALFTSTIAAATRTVFTKETIMDLKGKSRHRHRRSKRNSASASPRRYVAAGANWTAHQD